MGWQAGTTEESEAEIRGERQKEREEFKESRFTEEIYKWIQLGKGGR